MKKELSIIQILSCELVGLYYQFTMLRKLRRFTFEESLRYYSSHENMPEALNLYYAVLLSSSVEFCKNMSSRPLTYLKCFNEDELRAFIWLFDNVISSLEFYYEID